MQDTPKYWAILGPAGTGKSTRIRQLCEDESFGKQTSSTGIAALNIGGVTVNYLLGFFNLEDLIFKVKYDKSSLLRALTAVSYAYRYLIIDEISMLDGRVLDIIFKLVEEINRKRELGLLLVGDPGQLPVVDKETIINDGGRMFAIKPIPFFEAQCWKYFEVERLTKIYRQSNPEFIQSLIALRKGDVSRLKWFEDNVDFQPNFSFEFGGPTIMTRNNDVDQFNRKMLDQIEAESQFYPVIRRGEQRPEWKLIPDRIELRVGAMAMVLENMPQRGLANGDIGEITVLNENGAVLRFQRPAGPFLTFIGPSELKNEDLKTKKVKGSIERLPLRLAFASTVFKCQGLTFDKVQIKLRDSFMGRISGGMYTALSRVRSPEGLRLVGTPQDLKKAIYVDERVKCVL